MQVKVSEVGEKVTVVSVRSSKARNTMAKVCRALESLRLKVITASVASVAGSIVHNMFVEVTIAAQNGLCHVAPIPFSRLLRCPWVTSPG